MDSQPVNLDGFAFENHELGLASLATALIHRRDLSPLANLGIADQHLGALRFVGINAGRHAKGATPVPVRNPYTDEAIEARYHTAVVGLVAIERGCQRPSAEPEEVEVQR
jgi:propanediol dehydratase large subunit